MEEIKKAARVQKQAVSDEELALINQQSLRELTADDVFVFRIAACDNQIDRDFERFTEQTLEDLARLYVGRTVIMDHLWSATKQTARVYAGSVEAEGEVKRLVLRAYMLRNEASQPDIDAIEGGILREVSVGCAVRRVVCSICGADRLTTRCQHYPGQEYDGQICHMDLDGAADAYEVSFVAVPAQREAGVVKSGGARSLAVPITVDAERVANLITERVKEMMAAHSGLPNPDNMDAIQRAKARLELEKHRYGGI